MTFEQLTLGDTSAIDFTHPGEAEPKLSCKGADDLHCFDHVLPPDLYAAKAYITERRRIRFYDEFHRIKQGGSPMGSRLVCY